MHRRLWKLIVLALVCSAAPLHAVINSPTYVNTAYNVLLYGAIPNDAGDDTAAIQAAINAAPDWGTVYVPPGTYLVNNLQINNRVGLALRGAGYGVSILKRTSAGPLIATSDNCTDLFIHKLGFDAWGNTSGGGFAFTNARRIGIAETRFFDSNKQPLSSLTRYAWYFGRGSIVNEDLWIYRNIIDDLQVQVDHARRVWITGNTISRPVRQSGIFVGSGGNGGVVQQVYIEGNSINEARVTVGAIFVGLNPANSSNCSFQTIRIIGNMVNYSAAMSVTVTNAVRIGTLDATQATTGNTFDDTQITGNLAVVDVNASPGFTEAVVLANSSPTANFTFTKLVISDNHFLYSNAPWPAVAVHQTAGDYVGARNVMRAWTGSKVYNVVNYGAVANDGIDDTPNIQNAVNAAVNNDNATIYFPAGMYYLSDLQINNRSGLAFRGNGVGSTIIKRSNTSARMATVDNSTDLVFYRMTFDANGIGSYGGVVFYGVQRVAITETTFIDGAKQPLGSDDRYPYCFARGGVPSQDVWIYGNDISDLQLEVDYCQRITVTGNSVSRPTRTGGIGAFTISNNTPSSDYVVAGNAIVDAQVSAGAITFGLDPPSSNNCAYRHIQVVGNTISYGSTMTGGVANAVRLGTPNSSQWTVGNVYDNITVQANAVNIDPAGTPTFTEGIMFGNVAGFTFTRLTMDDNQFLYNGSYGAFDIRNPPADYEQMRNAVRRLVTLQGVVSLGDYAGDNRTVPLTLKMLNPSTGATVETDNLTLGVYGHYSLVNTLHGTYNLVARGSHWLGQRQSGIALGPDNVTVNFSLINGDVNGDNSITAADLAAVLAALDTASSSANLDGDGEVSSADLSIVLANLDATGN